MLFLQRVAKEMVPSPSLLLSSAWTPDGYRDSAGSYHESVFEHMHPDTLLPFVPPERMPDYQRRIQATVAAFIHLCDHRPAESITVQYLYFNGHEEEENAVPSANEL